MNQSKYLYFIKSLFVLAAVSLLMACQNGSKPVLNNSYPYNEAEINQLKIQISALEKLINQKNKTKSSKSIKNIKSPIKSITFRIGSKDDRIRIYWQDGSKTDLPCTKEQSIWACG